MLQNWLKDYTLIITSQNNKKKILLSLTNEHKILDLKFMTKEEFFEKYYFKYDERAYFYLRQKYHYDLDVCKLYLKNLYFIENHPYQNTKLQRLKQIKDELSPKLEFSFFFTIPFIFLFNLTLLQRLT